MVRSSSNYERTVQVMSLDCSDDSTVDITKRRILDVLVRCQKCK